ncbi:Protein T21H8.5 [Aphelenchoides avenae]|nr:Protein T21H8.5 [Aphelenchus avenae]
MESADENDRFHEANLILSSALKQLDEAMSKNGNGGKLYKAYTDSLSKTETDSVMTRSTPAGWGSPNNLVTKPTPPPRNFDSPTAAYHIINGHGFGAPESCSTPVCNGKPNAQATMHWVNSDASATKWEQRSDKDSSSMDSVESSGVDFESQPSDVPTSSASSTQKALDRFVKAIDKDSVAAPNSETKRKIVQWLMTNSNIKRIWSDRFLYSYAKWTNYNASPTLRRMAQASAGGYKRQNENNDAVRNFGQPRIRAQSGGYQQSDVQGRSGACNAEPFDRHIMLIVSSYAAIRHTSQRLGVQQRAEHRLLLLLLPATATSVQGAVTVAPTFRHNRK